MAVLFVCLLLALATIFRIAAEDFSLGLGWAILFACAVVILASGYVAFVEKGKYKITVRFKDGESIAITTATASQASKFQDAVHEALDQLDYHDTDQAKPTVVLASLEPTQLSTLSGAKPKVMRLSDEEDPVE